MVLSGASPAVQRGKEKEAAIDEWTNEIKRAEERVKDLEEFDRALKDKSTAKLEVRMRVPTCTCGASCMLVDV